MINIKRLLVIALLCGTCISFAEDFLLPEKTERRKSVGQLRQEVVDLMGTLIEQQAAVIEKQSKMQQILCKQLRKYADGDKKSTLSKASSRELQVLIKRLAREKERYMKEQEEHSKLLSYLTSNMDI